MRYHVQTGCGERSVDVRRRDGRLELESDGNIYRVDVAAVEGGGRYSILIDQRSYSVSVDGDGRDLSLIVDGKAFFVEVEDERERSMREISGSGSGDGGVVESVMPGIVRKIMVGKGDRVEVGDRLLVLEAMKMENEICAEVGGVVSEVSVEEGQAVEGGDALLSLESPSA